MYIRTYVCTQGTPHNKLDNGWQSNGGQLTLSRQSCRGQWMVASKQLPNVQNYIGSYAYKLETIASKIQDPLSRKLVTVSVNMYMSAYKRTTKRPEM
jgi:hypothetical protein